jgi:hypothetical protein
VQANTHIAGFQTSLTEARLTRKGEVTATRASTQEETKATCENKLDQSLLFGMKRGALNRRSKTRTKAKRLITSATNPHPLWLKPNSSERHAQERENEGRSMPSKSMKREKNTTPSHCASYPSPIPAMNANAEPPVPAFSKRYAHSSL